MTAVRSHVTLRAAPARELDRVDRGINVGENRLSLSVESLDLLARNRNRNRKLKRLVPYGRAKQERRAKRAAVDGDNSRAVYDTRLDAGDAVDVNRSAITLRHERPRERVGSRRAEATLHESTLRCGWFERQARRTTHDRDRDRDPC